MRRLLLVLMFLVLFAVPAFAQFDFPNSPTANQIISGPAGQAMKWDGTKWVAQFGPAAGPYLPLAGGTMTGPINNVTALGIGEAAPTAQGSILAGTYSGNFNTAMSLTNADATDTSAYTTYYVANGTHYGALQLAGMAATVNGPFADNLSLQTNAANGIVVVTNGPNANIDFFPNTLGNFSLSVQPGGLRLEGTQPQGPYVLFQPNGQPNPWAAFSSGATSNLNLSAGGHFNGSTWIADNATFHDLSLQSVGGSNGFNFYENTSLTVGNGFSPVEIAQLGVMTGGMNQGLHLFSPMQAYTCYNSFVNVPNGSAVTLVKTGAWGAAMTGLLTVYNTFSGAVSMNLYGVSGFGSAQAAHFSPIIQNNYGGGAAAFTLTVTGNADQSANWVATNTSGQTSTFYYWFLQTGGGSYVYCQ